MSKKELQLRKDIPVELTWDLTLIYQNTDEWEKDFVALDELVNIFNAYQGRLSGSAAVLNDAIAALDNMERKLEKLYTYAHLKHDEDTAEPLAKSLENRASGKAAAISAACAWFEPELLAIDDEKISAMLNEKVLEFYKPSIEELLRAKKHTLSEKEERILGALSDVLSSPEDIYESLTDADLRFPAVRRENKDKVELTSGNYIKFLESPDRKVRKRAFKAMFGSYRSIVNSCASTMDATVKKHVVSARLRNYTSALDKALFADELPQELYRNLIASVHRHIPELTEYLKFRRKKLKLKKLDMYDLYTPLVKRDEHIYTYQEAQKMVLEAFAVMGEEYVSVVKRAFDERWVDVMECRRKRSGAYSSGCYDTVPYLLLNFNGTLNDVFTLAHELGHSMHSYFSHKHQEYHYASYPIFAAEIASTTNELLLHDYLMKKYADDPAMQSTLLVHLIDEVRACIYRQTMFAEFELDIHELREKDVPLTADLLCKNYYELNARYYGGAVKADELIKYEWARIPHFYYNFYVFKYATGLSAAMKFAANILSGDESLKEKYYGFLNAGDSRNVLDILRTAGVDFINYPVVDDALKEFGKLVKQLKKVL
ncbi:MAG: oligoendopeptidase F [Lentisphaeria bacterium]|nr:oligoendopeptidase F [Lentisphaeria bacterium]